MHAYVQILTTVITTVPCTGVSSHMDDEYKWAGVEDPKVLITTSRDPSSRLKMFAKVSVRMGDEMLTCDHRQTAVIR